MDYNGRMATSALDVTPAEMAEYRATMARDAAADEEHRRALEAKAWDFARLAAARLRDECSATRVMLYGSLARGEFRRGSDVDIAAWGVATDRWLDVVGVGLETGREVEVSTCRAEDMRPEVLASALRDGIDL